MCAAGAGTRSRLRRRRRRRAPGIDNVIYARGDAAVVASGR